MQAFGVSTKLAWDPGFESPRARHNIAPRGQTAKIITQLPVGYLSFHLADVGEPFAVAPNVLTTVGYQVPYSAK